MQINMFQEELVRKVKGHAKAAIEGRQVARRLQQLLPTRLWELKNRHSNRKLKTEAHAMRLALTDKKYQDFIEEFVKVSGGALEARIQHETHLMLVYARQSLRAFRR